MTSTVQRIGGAENASRERHPGLTTEQRSALAAVFYRAPRDWRQSRDRAIALLVLSEGMRPAEVAALRIEQARTWRPVGTSSAPPPRGSRVARQAVVEWLGRRAYEGIPGEQAFVRDQRGALCRPNDVYRLVHRILRKAGIDPRLLGRLRLRDCVRRKSPARTRRARDLPRAARDRQSRPQPTP